MNCWVDLVGVAVGSGVCWEIWMDLDAVGRVWISLGEVGCISVDFYIFGWIWAYLGGFELI